MLFFQGYPYWPGVAWNGGNDPPLDPGIASSDVLNQ